MNTWRSTASAAALGLAAAVAVSASSTTAGSAAQLIITDPGVVQYWEFPVSFTPPPPPEPQVPEICGAVEDYAGVLHAEPGTPLVAPAPPQGQNLGWVLVGTDGDDVLVGNNKDDCLVGGPGDDDLRGGEGKDVLVGGPGADTLDGQVGPDEIFGDADDTCVVQNADRVVGCPAPPPVEDPKGPKPKDPARPDDSDDSRTEVSATEEDAGEAGPVPPDAALVVPEQEPAAETADVRE